jgi:putative redox protein
MRQNFTNFEIQLKAERAQEYPKALKNVSLTYRVWGDVEEDKFKKAIDLSLEKYCGVSNTLKPKVEIDYEYQINPKEEENY